MSLKSSGFQTPIDRGMGGGVQDSFAGTFSSPYIHDGLQWERSSKPLSFSQSPVVLPGERNDLLCTGWFSGAEKRDNCCYGHSFSYCSELPNILQNFMLTAVLRSFHTDAVYPLLWSALVALSERVLWIFGLETYFQLCGFFFLR